jgi:preprotein translocase subunit SecD
MYGCNNQKQKVVKPVDIEFRIAEHEPGKELEVYKFREFDKKFFLHREVLCNNRDIISAEVIRWKNEYAVEVSFSDSGSIKWAEATGNNIGRNIAILVNDELVTCPLINGKIEKGIAIINGEFSERYAQELAESINLN